MVIEVKKDTGQYMEPPLCCRCGRPLLHVGPQTVKEMLDMEAERKLMGAD